MAPMQVVQFLNKALKRVIYIIEHLSNSKQVCTMWNSFFSLFCNLSIQS